MLEEHSSWIDPPVDSMSRGLGFDRAQDELKHFRLQAQSRTFQRKHVILILLKLIKLRRSPKETASKSFVISMQNSGSGSRQSRDLFFFLLDE